MEEELEKIKQQFSDKGIPVYIGEFGANWRTMPADENQEKHNASIQTHYRVVVQKAMEKGMVPVVWDTNYRGMPSMTIINRKDLTIYNPYMMNGIHEAMEAVGVSVTALNEVRTDYETIKPVYDLQGRALTSALSKGIYIQEGKKFLVQ